MSMSKSISVGSIVIGCILLVLSLISASCGAVALSKVTSVDVSVGLWGLYFLIPGMLCVVAGRDKLKSKLGIALGTHILGIILAIVGLVFSATLWSILASTCRDSVGILSSRKTCTCHRGDASFNYKASCSDMETVRDVTGAVTITFAFIAIVSFVGSIYGCIGTCCASREPVVVVTRRQIPAQTNTVVMTSSHHQQKQVPNTVRIHSPMMPHVHRSAPEPVVLAIPDVGSIGCP